MGLFSALLGNAGIVKPDELKSKYQKLLVEDEEVQIGFKLIRDTFLFTNKRMIIVEVQGVTGSKREYLSVNYKAISRFAIETAGTFDLEAELKIWVSSESQPSIVKRFNRSVDVYEVQKILTHYVMR